MNWNKKEVKPTKKDYYLVAVDCGEPNSNYVTVALWDGENWIDPEYRHTKILLESAYNLHAWCKYPEYFKNQINTAP